MFHKVEIGCGNPVAPNTGEGIYVNFFRQQYYNTLYRICQYVFIKLLQYFLIYEQTQSTVAINIFPEPSVIALSPVLGIIVPSSAIKSLQYTVPPDKSVNLSSFVNM